MDPVGVHALAHVLQLIGISLVHGTVSCVIKPCKSFKFKLLACIGKIERAEVRDAELRHEVVAQPCLCVFDALTFHDNDAVGALLSVENGRGSIFQDIHTLYVEDVQVVEFFHGNLHAVQDDERIVHALLALIGDKRRCASDEERRNRIRVGTGRVVLHQHHARSHCGNAGKQVGRR